MGWEIVYAMLFVLATFGTCQWGAEVWKGEPIDQPKTLAIFLFLTGGSFFLKAWNIVIPMIAS